jgi:hypothetical protein
MLKMKNKNSLFNSKTWKSIRDSLGTTESVQFTSKYCSMLWGQSHHLALEKGLHSMSIIHSPFFSHQQRVKLLFGAEHGVDQTRERNQVESNERGVFEEFARHGRTEG